MRKYLKSIMSVFIGAALMTTALPATQLSAFAAGTSEAGTGGSSESENQEPSALTLNPVVLNYSLTTSQGKAITSLLEKTPFNMKITIKDIKVKTSEIPGANNDEKSRHIDFIKNMDTFKGTFESIKIVSTGNDLLTYEVVLKQCQWTGGDTGFGFMVGYTGGSDYAQGSVTLTECTVPDNTPDPVINVAEPTIKITAVEPSAPIRAGEIGEFQIKLKNLSTTYAYNMLAEVSSSDDILIVEGTGTQDIDGIDFKDEKVLTVKYKALEKINSEKQNFTVSLKYYYDNGTSEAMGSTSSQVAVAAEISTVEKVYPVITTSFSMSEEVLEADKEYSAVLTIKNIGTADIKGLFVNFTGSDDIVISDGTGFRYFEGIPMNAQKSITMKFRTMKQLSSARENITASLKYSYVMGSEEQEGSYESAFVMFGKIAEEKAPLPVITYEPLEEALQAGKHYRKAFYISNKGNGDMKNISINVKGSEGLTITDGREQFFVDSLEAGKDKRILVYFDTNAELTAVSQTLSIDIEYYYEKDGALVSGSKSGTVSMNSGISTAPVLRISGEKLDSALVADTDYEYTIYVKNYGDITVRNIFVDFTATEALYFLDGTESGYIDLIRPQETAKLKVKFRTVSDITSAKQGISAEMKYSYGRNSSIIQTSGSSSIVLIAAPNNKTDDDNKENVAAPNVIIGRYDIGADQIAAGEVFGLSLDFFNTSPSISIENMVMTVNAGGDLSVYGGTNSFYYQTLPAAGAGSEDIQLRVLPTAMTGTSSVSVSFKYDYVSGENRNTVTSEQTLYIPVYQPDKMSFSLSKPTYDIYTGNETYITLSYINKGRADAANVKVELVSGSSDSSGAADDNVYGDLPEDAGSMTYEMPEMNGNEPMMSMHSDSMAAIDGEIGYVDSGFADGGYVDGGYVDGGFDMGGGAFYDDPGFTALSTEKVIGNVAAGGNGTVDFVVTPTRSGEVTMIFRITYEDSNMNEIVKEIPLTINVMEMNWGGDDMYFPMTMETPGEDEGGFPWWIVFVGGGVLLVAVIIVIIVVVRKKHKKGKKLTADDIDWEDELDEESSDDKTKV